MSAPPEPHMRQNPHLASCPDFSNEDYDLLRQGVMALDHIDAVEAIAKLVIDWTTHNEKDKERWLSQVSSDKEAETERIRICAEMDEEEWVIAEKEAEEERNEKNKKKPQLDKFDSHAKVADHIEHRIPLYAQTKINDRKHVHLWYFLPDAAKDTAAHKLAAPDSVDLLQDKDSGSLSLQQSLGAKPSTNACPDAKLKWQQWSLSQGWFLREIKQAGWPDVTIDMLASFFYALNNHHTRSLPNSDSVILRYADEVRYQWHLAIEDGRPAPNLAVINDTLLTNLRNEIVEAEKVAVLSDLQVHVLFFFSGSISDNSVHPFLSSNHSLGCPVNHEPLTITGTLTCTTKMNPQMQPPP